MRRECNKRKHFVYMLQSVFCARLREKGPPFMKRGEKTTRTEEDLWGKWHEWDKDEWEKWDPDLAYAIEQILQKQDQWFTLPGDEARLDRLRKGTKRIGPSLVLRRWRQLSKARRQFTMALGVGSPLTGLFAEPDKRRKLNDWYKAAGWPGLMAQLVLWKAPHQAIFHAIMFDRWRFVPDYCDYKKHWYFRHTVGRRPEACPLHRRAARQYRHRKTVSAYRRTR